MPSSSKYSRSPLNTYHSDVMQAMCSQMVHSRRPRYHEDVPLPPTRSSKNTYSSNSSSRSSSTSSSSSSSSSNSSYSTSPSSICSPPSISISPSSSRRSPPSSNIPTSNSGLSQHVQEEMARRVKADRVLQDLSSDKSRQQARARETARRNKWAKNVASAVPSVPEPSMQKPSGPRRQKSYGYAHGRRVNPQVA